LASQDGRKTAAEAAAEWQRGAADPETVRRRREFMEAKRRRAAAAGGDDVDQARASVAGKIKLAEDT
jgi:alkanesulfonate monooxygenase SsuD/methylene tetrahydromethanopterin reductase-like flavin-dependent oxidoreductase (luciferase family)